MPMRYMVVAVNEVRNSREIIDHFATMDEAEIRMAEVNDLIESGAYSDDEESTILHIEEIEIPDMEEL
jgi:hypothetical protein